MEKICTILGYFMFHSLVLHVCTSQPNAEQLVISTLFNEYEVNARGVDKLSDTVTVHMGITLNQIIDMDEKSQSLKAKVWYRFIWRDVRLAWNPSSYENLTNIKVSPRRLWFPDIVLYNEMSGAILEDRLKFQASIYHDGTVQWYYSGTQESFCHLDMKYFPWDRQICPLKFGSWGYDGTLVDILNQSTAGDTSHFTSNGEWDLMAIPVRRHEIFYLCCVEPYPDLTFYVILHRKPLFYLFNLVMPGILITVINVLVFILPPASGEKVSLSVTVLLAMTVFLLLIAETMPTQSEVVPLIGQYFGATIGLMALSTYMTVMVLYIHHRGSFGYQVPRWIRVLVLQGLGTVLCMREAITENLSEQKRKCNKKKQQPDLELIGYQNEKEKTKIPEIPFEDNRTNMLLHQMLNIMKKSHTSQKQKDQDEAINSDWALVSMVIDRSLLIVFLIFTVLVNVYVFYGYPRYSPEKSIDLESR